MDADTLACVDMLFEEFPFTEGRALFTPTGAGGRTFFIEIRTLHRRADRALAEVKKGGCCMRGVNVVDLSVGRGDFHTVDPVGCTPILCPILHPPHSHSPSTSLDSSL